MKSKGDPILDLQALVIEKPRNKEDLKVAMEELGWGVPIDMILRPSIGTYVILGEDGLYRPRDGTVREVVEKVLKG